MMGKPIGIVLLIGISFLASTSISLANTTDFAVEKRKQYDRKNGNSTVRWYKHDPNLDWHHFDKEKFIQVGWYLDMDGEYHWLDKMGQSFDSVFYGMWQKDEGGWRYLREDGISYPIDTWEYINEAWYHFDENGYMQTGWYTEQVETKEQRYYLKNSGKRACDEVLQLDQENWYIFDDNGIFIGTTPVVKTEEELKLEELEKLASQIVTELITEEMTKREKATEIYRWIQSHIGYIATSDKSDWVAEAIRGLQTRRGDCFTYFAVARAMLDAAEIENLPVYPKEGYHVHYWNIIYVEGGWYHFDTTPRKSGSTFCIVTNAQYDALSGARYSTRYLENGMEYPEMATE